MKKLILLVTFLLIAFSLYSCGGGDTYKVGDEVYTNQQTVGAITSGEFDEMIRISNAKDGQAFTDNLLFGYIKIIEGNQKCKVLNVELGKVQCRLDLNGVSTDLWINSSHLRK